MKTCYKCKKILDYINFGKLKSSKDGYRYDCKNCRKIYRQENKEIISLKYKKYYEINKEIILEKNKEYRNNNKESIKNQKKEYRTRNEVIEHIKIKNKEYLSIRKIKIKEKRVNDLNFKLSEIYRSKFYREIKGKKYSNFIGCSIDFFKNWIEYNFDKTMNWNNLGIDWHLDHIIPISIFNFNDENEIKICFHWTNIQPLNKKENISKSNKIFLHHYFNNLVSIFRFNKNNKQFMGYQNVSESLHWLRKKLRYGENAPYEVISIKDIMEIDNQQPSS